MAATFDTGSLKQMADYAALEGRAVYNESVRLGKAGQRFVGLTYWTPNINIFRDPRWGRGQETLWRRSLPNGYDGTGNGAWLTG
jgi:beta-glucosidase